MRPRRKKIPTPKYSTNERPLVPVCGVNSIDGNGTSDNFLIRDTFGNLWGDHKGIRWPVSESDFYHFMVKQRKKHGE